MTSEQPINLEDQIIRHQREAEINFAACVHIDPTGVVEEFGWLTPDDLLDIDIRDWWRKVITGADASKAAIDVGILYRLVGQSNDNGLQYYQKGIYAQVIGEDVYLRAIARHNKDLAKALFERNITDSMTTIQSMAQAIPASAREFPTAVDAHLDFVAGMEEDPQVLYSGIANLDLGMGGFERGTLNILAARPSMGKTAAGWQIAEHNAAHGYKTLYISLEMKKRQLWMRRACGIAGIESRIYKAGKLSEEQKRQLIDISAGLVDKYQQRLVIIDTVPYNTKNIWQAVAEVRPDLLVVDHMGLIDRPGENEVRELGQLSWAGKTIAKQFDLVSLYLYQINRGVEGRDNKRPVMSDLRQSGEIEQNADTVSFLYRQDYYDDPKPGQIVSDTEWIVAKNRDGARNIRVNLEYHLKQQMFYAAAQRQGRE